MSLVDEFPLPQPLQSLSSLLDERIECLAAGSSELESTALTVTKYVYDCALATEVFSQKHIAGLLSSLSPALAPQTRSRATKRKRSPSPSPEPSGPNLDHTPITELFVDGLNDDQIWAQLELRSKAVCGVLEYVLDGPEDHDDETDEESGRSSLEADEDVDSEEDGSEESLDSDEDGEDEDDDSEEDDDDDDDDDEMEDEENEEAIVELRDPSDESQNEDDMAMNGAPSLPLKKHAKRHKGGHPELDDSFFSLAAFNAETERMEARAASKGRLGGDSDEEDESEEEDVDLFAPVDGGTHDADMDGEPAEPFYKDFFEPPARSAGSTDKGRPITNGPRSESKSKVRFHAEVRVKKIKAKGKGLPTSMMYSHDDEDDEDADADEGRDEDEGDAYGEVLSDGESDDEDDEEQSNSESGSQGDDNETESSEDDREAMERFKDDLFADDDNKQEQQDMTAHEKRMAGLREEIAALEAENVAKKKWTLMGEATSRSRPQNSLLEEDLDFERVMKSVPVITEEVVHSLEEKIKARILESQFNDVVRKRPLEDKPFLPSRVFELSDQKSKQSLAEIYEDEYVAAQTGGVAGEDRDGKLKKEHAEIEKLWEQISGKLDALSNAHFTPKAPKASISTVTNVAAATLESALPTAMSSSSMLAPEEMFAPPSASNLRARSELTPAEKRALHNKQKKSRKKTRSVLTKTADSFTRTKKMGDIKKQKEAALKGLVKTGKGVTIVGKESRNNAAKAHRTRT